MEAAPTTHRTPALLVALALLAVPAAAFPEPDAPVFAAVPFTGDFHVAWRLHLPADSFTSVWFDTPPGDATFASLAFWMIEADTLAFNGLVQDWWYPEGGTELALRTPMVEGPGLAEGRIAYDRLEMRVDFEPFATKDWIFVVIGGVDGELAGEVKLFGDRGATLLGTTSGGAFMHTDADFDGDANVVARHELPVRQATAEARVALDAAVTERAEGRMFASFIGGAHTNTHAKTFRMGYDGPAGSQDGREWYLVAGEPAGDYTFRIDQQLDYYDNLPTCRFVNGEPCWREPVVVLGADVRVP